MQTDAGLLRLLLGDEELCRRFFAEVDGIRIFDKMKFAWVINNRQFLPDSYTRFKNKIGLGDENGELLSASGDVELVFPYKDCVLEGGQTKEEARRQEIFYNETLAPDEVDRLLEPKGSEPDFTRGTLEGDIAASPITFYRLQCDSEGKLRSYIAQGEVLPVKTRSFGGIGVFAIPEMGRFYRHVLVEKRYPHHGAVAFGHYGKALFEVMKMLGVEDIAYNQPKSLPYPTENPFV